MRSILRSIGLILTLAGVVAAQATGSSVFSYSFGKGGSEAKTAAVHLEAWIGKGILDKFPCVDQMDMDSVVAILDNERQRQMLSGDADDAILENVASSIGADYIIVVRGTTMENGKTYLNVVVMDTRTGRAVVRRSGEPASGEALVDVMLGLEKQVLQDISGLFKGKCTPHWSGTITFTYKYETREQKDERFPGGDKGVNTRSYLSTWMTENTIQAILNGKGGEDPNKSSATVIHRFKHTDQHIVNENIATWCRPPNANSYWKRLVNKESEIGTDQGEASSVETVWVTINRSNGTYKISVKYPAVKATSKREITATGVACFDAKPSSAVSTGDAGPGSAEYLKDGNEEVTGEFDPKNPDVLSGTTTTGDDTSGRYTVKWNLRLVKPKSSK